MSPKKGLMILAVLICVDWLSKVCAYSYLQAGQLSFSSPLLSLGGIDFDLSLVGNQGGAWGVLASRPQLLLGLRLAMVALLLIWIFFLRSPRVNPFPMLLILAGAVGNICDLVFYGCVVDFLHFTFWGYSYPVFNFADSFICVGMVWLVGQSMRVQKSRKRGRQGVQGEPDCKQS